MVTIPGGQFLMGSDTGLEYESPAHLVTLSSFEISKCEITNYQFQAFVNETGYQTVAERNNRSFTWKSYAIKGRDSYPVVLVTWSDAEEYCKWLSTKQNTTYRLPTESEWEYAARGGDNRQSYPWGDKLAAAQANFAPDSKRSSYAEPILDFIKPVGSYPANAFGLHDLIGNVFEWTADWFNEKYYQSSPSVNPMGPDNGKSRVIRGGSWAHQANYCTVFYRKPNVPDFPASYIGFRVVRVITDSSMH
jgi:formylglycine-generating enzyme required for sulfatase activity